MNVYMCIMFQVDTTQFHDIKSNVKMLTYEQTNIQDSWTGYSLVNML